MKQEDRTKRRGVLLFLAMIAFGYSGVSHASPAERTAKALEAIRGNPAKLIDFVTRMPKGGELHHHLTGSIYAESYIDYAVADGDCIDRKTMTIVKPPCDATAGRPPATDAQTDFELRNDVIDAWSIRNFVSNAADRSPEDHFFRAFFEFALVTDHHWGEMMAEVTHRAGAQNILYIETMLTPDQGEASALGRKLGWTDDFAAMRTKLFQNGMDKIVADGSRNLDEGIAGMNRVLGCGTSKPDVGCAVTLRFQYQILRALPREDVFAQMVAAFALAARDPRVVGVNPVMPQDDYTALHDFQRQLRMIDFLHKIYPQVHLSLHAGELTAGQVPPEELYSHIRDSITLGHAERIGHGQDIIYETNSPGLLAEMARRHIAVESTLTTEQIAGGIPASDHPLLVYLKAGVPVSLSTDDEGVARTELSWEFRRAVETFHLDYPALKQLVRNSLDYAFLPGKSMWTAPGKYSGNFVIVAPCTGEAPSVKPPSKPATSKPTSACQSFLADNEKARLEWAEEAAFSTFESGF